MLVLSRHMDEQIVITDTLSQERIELMVVEIRGDNVRLGLTAGPRFTIHRSEIQSKVDAKAAGKGGAV